MPTLLTKPLEPKSKDGKNRGTKILHLSDLHFDRASHFTPGKKKGDGTFEPPGQNEIEDHLNNLLTEVEKNARDDGPFDLVLVTGDLIDFDDRSWIAHQTAMTTVRDFLTYLCSRLNIRDDDGMVIIPGNHDYLYLGIRPKQWATEAFAKVFDKWMGHRWYPGLNLLIASFDSNVDDSSLRFATGYVNKRQVDDFESVVREQGLGNATATAYRLALVHHHVLPIAAAEELKPGTWYERLIGRKLIGTPELMLMRNAGHFTKFLLKHGFHLALHGHLHRHDSGSYRCFLDGRYRLLEIIACGATSRPKSDEPCAFNVIRLQDSGVLEAAAHHISAGGLLTTEELKTVPYETIRGVRYDEPPEANPDDPADGQSVVCHRYTRFWEVRLPAGDVISEEVVEGLRSVEGTQKEVLLRATQEGLDQLAEASISAECPAQPGRVKAKIKIVRPKAGVNTIDVSYVLEFDPELDANPVTVHIRRVMFGAYLPSREAHRLWNRDLGIEPHKLHHAVRWPCEQLALRLRIGNSTWSPTGLRLDVVDPKDQPAPWEMRTDHVIMEARPVQVGQPAEGIVAVYRPRLGYSYGMRWDILETEPIAEGILYPAEKQLLRLKGAVHDRRRSAAAAFLGELLRTLEQLATDGGKPALKIGAILFGFNREAGRLEPIVEDGPGDLHFGSVGWGRDIIGTAFQRQAPVFYSRHPKVRDQEARTGRATWEIFRDLPDAVQVILALPLPGQNTGDWPIAALALASTDAASGLHKFDSFSEILKRVYLLWGKNAVGIM